MSYIDSAINSTASSATGGGFLGMGKKGWGYAGLGAAAVLPGLLSMGGGGDYDKILKQLGEQSETSFDTSKTLGADSHQLYSEILPYIRAIAGGDRQAILGATMPERKRVIDQYATARKALAEFGPRSGGTAGAMAGMNAQQASDLSMIGANARTQGVDTAANLAGGLQGQAQNAQSLGLNALNTQAYITNQQQQMQAQSAGQWGQALGLIAGLAFL